MTSNDFFQRARSKHIAMPAVVPEPDGDLEDEPAPAAAPAQQAPAQDAFDEEPDELTVLASTDDAPPEAFEFGDEVEPGPGCEFGHESEPAGGLVLGHETAPGAPPGSAAATPPPADHAS